MPGTGTHTQTNTQDTTGYEEVIVVDGIVVTDTLWPTAKRHGQILTWPY